MSNLYNVENREVTVKVKDESYIFPIFTLVFYFFFPPIAFLLNILGLFLGPHRGCFVTMLIFVLLPSLILFSIILGFFGISLSS